jgi:GDPmannose 4,6-dehydratase
MNGNSLAGTGRAALIVGVNGQDGSYLAERLKCNNWNVIGMGRQQAARSEIISCLSAYHSVDIADTKSYQQILVDLRVDVVFHTAAVHGPAGFQYESVWLPVHQVNTLSLHATLEYARLVKSDTRIIYFSSAKVFGDLDEQIISEESCRYSNCIYTLTKNSSSELIRYYRNHHGINASVLWLFNHESARRSNQYFVMKVLSALQKSIEDKKYKTNIASLDFWCDWGSAREFMTLIADTFEDLAGEDFVLATGKTVWARDIVCELFLQHGLLADAHILQDKAAKERKVRSWVATSKKFEYFTGKHPVISGIDVYKEIFSSTHFRNES